MKQFIVIVTAIILIVAFFVFMMKMVGDTNRIVYNAGTEIIDRRFTRPDTYELLYKTTFENGLSVEQWVSVTREDYIERWNAAQEQKSAER